uniref:acetoacetate--CoA ligase n=1 Tax=Dietzia sp. TaxID=1871616 RepID=UPI002FDB25A1
DALAVDSMPGAEWFPGFRLNYVDQVLRHADAHPDRLAIIHGTEPGPAASSDTTTFGELRDSAAALAARLRLAGVEPGDRVAAYVPDIAEGIVAFLATAWIGAVWSACGQDYAPAAAASRLGQLEPKVLVAADGYRNGGKWHDKREDTAELARLLPGEPVVIEVRRSGEPSAIPAAESWSDALEAGEKEVEGNGTPDVIRVPFNHPLWVLFSSGTTGKPKGIVHGHGGVLLEHLKVLGLHAGVRAGDRLFWYTTPSWMMWNYRSSAVLVGATAVCFEGSPVKPPEALWEFAARERVTLFGTSPGQILASRKAGLHPARDLDLSSLRAVASSGSTMPADSFRWIHDEVGGVPVLSISGGTDVVSAFAGGQSGHPVFEGELSAAYLGTDLRSWDPDGNDLTGEVGEMVIARPMPSMPVEFWNDPSGERYRSAYFDTYPGVWRHGDWIKINSRGGVTIHGRSDATLNRNGVRMGSADIYGVVEGVDGVAEAFVLGVEGPDAKYWMPLFVVPTEGTQVDDALRERLVAAIRRDLSPRHVPDEITEAPGIPHTKTGKKLEVPVTAILAGRTEVNVDPQSLDDPSLLDWYRARGDAHEW